MCLILQSYPEVYNTTIWNHVNQVPRDRDFYAIMNGFADMSALSQFIIDQGTDFEDYMSDKAGNFQVLNESGDIDPWNSLLWKLNALCGPVLALPFYINRTDDNAEDWDTWWNALQDLTPSNEPTTVQFSNSSIFVQGYPCYSNAESPDFVPLAVSFPSIFYGCLDVTATDGSGCLSTGDASVVDMFMYHSGAFEYTYAQRIVEITTTTSQHQLSTTTKVNTEIDISEKAGISLDLLSAEETSTIKTGISETVGAAFTTTSTYTHSTTTTVSIENDYNVLPEAVFNFTMYTAQVQADIYITGDIVYDPDNTGIQTWLSNATIIPQLGENIPELLLNKQLTTLGQIQSVAKMAMGLIGAEWSDTFLDTLISASIAGKVSSTAGTENIAETYACDIDSVPAFTCNKLLAESFPPNATECPAGFERRAIADDGLEPIPNVASKIDMLSLIKYDTDCYSYERVDGDDNKFYVHEIANCTK
eukprot:Clim_evm262s157 gene=Clim_evmTU262s157